MAYTDVGLVTPKKPTYYEWGNGVRGNQEQHEADVTQLYLDTTANADDIVQLYSDTTANLDAIASNDGDITTLFADTTTNADNITLNDADITQLYSDTSDNADAIALANSGTAGGAAVYDGSGDLASTAAGTSGQVLTSNGSAAPTFQDSAGGSGTSGLGSEYLLTLDSTAPSVLNANVIYSDNTALVDLMSFTDATSGQVLFYRCNDNFTVVDNGMTHTGMKIPLINGDTMAWHYDGTNFKQFAGSVGMGDLVTLSEPDVVGVWISDSQTSASDVDLSGDGVRKGSSAAKLSFIFLGSGGPVSVRAKAKGATNVWSYQRYETANLFNGAEVSLDDDAVFEAYFQYSWSSTTNRAEVVGYYI